MGREARCYATVAGERGERTALLETDEVVLSGRPRLRLPFAAMRRVEADGDRLLLEGDDGPVVLELGEREASRWAERIRNPPGLAERLGLRGGPVAVIGTPPPALVAALGEIVPPAEADTVFLVAGDAADLVAVDEVAAGLRPGAALWVVYPKAEVREADVLAAGRRTGRADTRVARVDGAFTALRFSARR